MKPQDVVFTSEAERERFAVASLQPRFTRGQQKILLTVFIAVCLSLVAGSVYYAATGEEPESGDVVTADGSVDTNSAVDPKTGEVATPKRAHEKPRARAIQENIFMGDGANATGQKAQDFYVDPLEVPDAR